MQIAERKIENFVPLIAGLILLVLFFLSYLSSFQLVLSQWLSSEAAVGPVFASGLLVIGCGIYLLFLNRDQFASLVPTPFSLAAIPLVALTLLWVSANLVGVQSVQLTVFPLILLSAIALAFGMSYLRLIFLPVFLLFFALPIWAPALPFLQDLTTFAVRHFLVFLGRPLYVEGHVLVLPGGSFIIDPSCAGLRFLLVSCILSCMLSYLLKLTKIQFLALLGFVLSLSLLANWIRVAIVVLAGDATNMESSLVEDHNTLGWVIYLVVVLVPFLYVSKFFPDRSQLESTLNSANSDAEQSISLNRSRFTVSMILACMLILVGPVSHALLVNRLADNERAIELPGGYGSWERGTATSDWQLLNWAPNYQGFTERLHSPYTSEQGRVELFIYHYQQQAQGAELINIDNNFADRIRWRAIGNPTTIRLTGSDRADGMPVQINAQQIRSGSGQQRLVWYWYVVGGRSTSNGVWAKVYELLGAFGGRSDANLIAIATNCGIGCNSAAELLESYIYDMRSEILQGL